MESITITSAAIGAALIGFIFWIAKKYINQIDNHGTRLDKVESNMVTAEEVRTIFHQSNETMKIQLSEIQNSLAQSTAIQNSILQKMAEREGYERALKESRENG